MCVPIVHQLQIDQLKCAFPDNRTGLIRQTSVCFRSNFIEKLCVGAQEKVNFSVEPTYLMKVEIIKFLFLMLQRGGKTWKPSTE